MILRLCRRIRWYRCYSANAKSIEELEQEFTQLRINSGFKDHSRQSQNVLVVHPKIRWGQNADPTENVGLKLEEACALVQTLPGFAVSK